MEAGHHHHQRHYYRVLCTWLLTASLTLHTGFSFWTIPQIQNRRLLCHHHYSRQNNNNKNNNNNNNRLHIVVRSQNNNNDENNVLNESKNDIEHNDDSIGFESAQKEREGSTGTVITTEASRKNNDATVPSIRSLWEFVLSLKEELYKRIQQALKDLVTIIKRSTKEGEAWVRDDAVGQLVSSALALVAFFAAVAAFAVWNIELLGGKQWSGPTQVTVPVVRLPTSSSSSSGTIKFQKPKWKAPQIRTNYNNNNINNEELD